MAERRSQRTTGMGYKTAITLVVGSYPPDACGVGDYTSCLAAALAARGHDVEVLVGERWRSASTQAGGRAVVHLQYPSVGTGASLAPLWSLIRGAEDLRVLTLHEFSQSHALRKLASLAMAFFADVVVANTAIEARAIGRWSRSVRRPAVIPIGSNIPTGPTAERVIDVVHFGLLGPGKGLESFFELVELAPRDWVFAIVGDSAPQHRRFADEMADRAARLGVRWFGRQTDTDTARLLQSARIAYLPYPDGASERRGSLLAALSNGVVVITTDGPATTAELRAAVLLAANPRQALDVASAEMARPSVASAAGLAYARRRSWDEIASRHEASYADELSSLDSTRHMPGSLTVTRRQPVRGRRWLGRP